MGKVAALEAAERAAMGGQASQPDGPASGAGAADAAVPNGTQRQVTWAQVRWLRPCLTVPPCADSAAASAGTAADQTAVADPAAAREQSDAQAPAPEQAAPKDTAATAEAAKLVARDTAIQAKKEAAKARKEAANAARNWHVQLGSRKTSGPGQAKGSLKLGGAAAEPAPAPPAVAVAESGPFDGFI